MNDTRPLPWYRSNWAIGAFVVCLLFNFFFHATWAFNVNLWNDEGCYLATLYKLMNQPAEGFCTGRTNYFAPGAPLIWLPAGWFAYFLSWLSGLWTFHWLQPVIGLYSFALFGGSIGFLFASVNKAYADGTERNAVFPWLLAVAIVLNSPILYYAGKWAIMPHTAQALTAFATVYLLERRRWIWAIGVGILLSITRFNDVPVILMIMGKAWDERESWAQEALQVTRKKIAIVCIAVVFAALVGTIGWIAFYHGYGPSTLSDLFLRVSMRKLVFFLFHDRWGVFWMSPWWVVGLGLGLVFFRRLSWFGRGAALWVLTEAYVATSWGGNGGDFGYRYLIGSYAGVWVIWRELAFANDSRYRRFFYFITFLGAAWMTYLNIAYRALPELNPVLIPVDDEHPNALVFGGLSHFQIVAFRQILNPTIYLNWFVRDMPTVQLWQLWRGYPGVTELRGTDELAFAVATFSTLFYLLVFARRNLSHFLACRKASRKAGTENPSAATTPPESPSVP